MIYLLHKNNNLYTIKNRLTKIIHTYKLKLSKCLQIPAKNYNQNCGATASKPTDLSLLVCMYGSTYVYWYSCMRVRCAVGMCVCVCVYGLVRAMSLKRWVFHLICVINVIFESFGINFFFLIFDFRWIYVMRFHYFY